MKKIIFFIFFLISILLIYFFLINKPINYKNEYKIKDDLIVESFNKNKNFYTFNINDSYTFVINHKYSKKRNLVKKINKENNCYSIEVFNQKTEYVCLDNKKYKVIYKEIESKIKQSKNNIDIYDDNHDIYLWNNFGITDLINNKEYKFLKNEKYDNPLYYINDEYIVFPDYDIERTFNKFYLFNLNKKKIEEFKFDYNISFDSYFLGEYDNKVYLYDQRNEIEYEINLNKEKIKAVSNKDGILYYDGNKLDMVDKKKYKYDEIKFIKDDIYVYDIVNKNLVYRYYGSNKNINIINDVDDIILANNKDVFFLKDTIVYHYNIDEGAKKVISNFEWNFNYKDKLFIKY